MIEFCINDSFAVSATGYVNNSEGWFFEDKFIRYLLTMLSVVSALCACLKSSENDALEYTLGPSMMESDSRIETTARTLQYHFTKAHNMQKNVH